MLTFRHRLRLAGRLDASWHAALRQGAATATDCSSLHDDEVADLARLSGYARRAQECGWSAAAAEVTDTIRFRLSCLNTRLQQQLEQLNKPQPEPLTLRHWLAELQQLSDEFDPLDVDWKRECLRAVTEPVILEGLHLGRFAIELFWQRMGERPDVRCFEIDALEPNPAAASHDKVTHPHVRDGILCAGDAVAPISRALGDGRLADAFLLVRSVLSEYNRRSPYVAIDDWENEDESNESSCDDCGYSCHSDDMHYCESCSSSICDECYGRCSTCDRSICRGCLSACAVCEVDFCARCLVPSACSERKCCSDCRGECQSCGKTVASDELDEVIAWCTDCVAAAEPDTTPSSLTLPSAPASQPPEMVHA